jgi:threonine/homoserine/homoserine lactone efflux protein
MIELMAVATITILAVISPGADFAMVTRNSVLYGRSAGLFSSLGVAMGVQLHVFYTMIGVGLLIRSSPGLFMAIKVLGSIYLIYVGYKTFLAKATDEAGSTVNLTASMASISRASAFKNGFFTNALNPKTTLFVVSVYTQVVDPNTSVPIQFMYGVFMSFAHWLWFSFVSIFLSENRLRKHLLSRQIMVNKVIGGVLITLGAMLLFSTSLSL